MLFIKNKLKNMFISTSNLFELKSSVEILGDNKILVQGVININEYSDDVIKLKLDNKEIHIYGKKLNLGGLTKDTIEIYGKVIRIEYL